MARWLFALSVMGIVCLAPAAQSAQQATPSAEPARKGQPEKWAQRQRSRAPQPDVDEQDQLSPRQLDQRWPQPSQQMQQSQPAAPAGQQPLPAQPQSPPAKPQAAPAPQQPAAAQQNEQTEQPAAPARGAKGAEPPRSIACSGVFGKESSHMKLATRFDSRNVAFTEVDGPEGSKLMASVLFPKDPKRRLEVLWQNEASRSDTHLIVINGQSTWAGPKGLRLGLSLAALEKLNGKPFKLAGFDQPNGGSVSDWQGGALEKLPGGCRLGLRLAADAKATEAARNEAAGKELASNDAKARAVRPIVAEIILGY